MDIAKLVCEQYAIPDNYRVMIKMAVPVYPKICIAVLNIICQIHTKSLINQALVMNFRIAR